MAHEIECPECGHKFMMEDALRGDLEKEIKDRLSKDYNKRWEAMTREKEKEIEDILRTQREAFEEKTRKKIAEENELILKALREDLSRGEEKLKGLQARELEYIRQSKALKEKESEMDLKMAKWELEKSLELEQKIRKDEQEKNELKMREMQKQLDDQKKLAEEMKRRAEQGSMQMQGEVQEEAIEEWLAKSFPLDEVEEVKKGARGGDCTLRVKNELWQECGLIYFESKRTKDFQPSWIAKFKADMREKKADLGVLVTEALPKDMPRGGQRDGIWICTFQEFKGFVFVLRDSLLRVSQALASNENRADKMGLLYNYLTSSDFKMNMEAIVMAFAEMKTQVDSEKRAMEMQWKKREKLLETVMKSTTGMYGSIKGIAGSAVSNIPLLEMDGGEMDKQEN